MICGALASKLAELKKHISRDHLIDCYMDTVVELREEAFTVEELGNMHNFAPEAFYEYFLGFDDLNKAIFKVFIDNAIDVLGQSMDYEGFSKTDKLLSLYYTLFENFTLNREFVLLTIQSYGFNLNALPLLSELRASFTLFIDSLEIETIGVIDSLESIQKKSLKEGLWVQFLITLKFWMADDSPQCEKTDVFIDKSVNTGMGLLNTKWLNNVVDLGKFLYTEKIKPKGTE